MKYFNFLVALSLLVAAGISWFTTDDRMVPMVFLIAAGFTFAGAIGKLKNEQNLAANPVILTPEQEEQIREMKRAGRPIEAIKQVRVWHRQSDLRTAKEIVEKL